MRWVQVALGSGLILTACAITLDSWSTVVDLDARHRAYDRIGYGMTLQQVRAILGPSDSGRILGTGSVKPGSEMGAPMIYEYRWEDTYASIDVRFWGSSVASDNDRVTEIVRQMKSPPDLVALRCVRLSLLLLALSGLALLLAGLFRSRPVALAAPAISSETPPA
jgi:hypothetical protein